MGGVVECRREWIVGPDHVASHLAGVGVRVLSTPCMIFFIEATIRECLDDIVGPGRTTVGVRVDARHRAPAAEGSRVIVEARVFWVDGSRALAYAMVFRDDGVLVGEAIHERRVVEPRELAGRAGGRP